jgi:hypothetical protein
LARYRVLDPAGIIFGGDSPVPAPYDAVVELDPKVADGFGASLVKVEDDTAETDLTNVGWTIVIQTPEEEGGTGTVTVQVGAEGTSASVPSQAYAFDVPAHNVDEVLAWVGADPDRAAWALSQEKASGDPRVTLIRELGGEG